MATQKRASLAPYEPYSMQELLKRTTKRFPNKVAIIDGERRFTYRQFDEYSDRFAAALEKLGVAKADYVGILVPNCVEFEIAFYGIVKAGAVVTTVNSGYREGEIAHQLSDSGAKVLVVHEDLLQMAESAQDAITDLNRLILIKQTSDDPESFWGLIEHAPAKPHGAHVDAEGDMATVDDRMSVMTPTEVEAIAVACIAALERRSDRARTGPICEFADLGLRREALEYAAKRDIAATDWMVGLGVERDLTGLEMLGVARAATDGREWTPQPDGRPVITLPIWSGECCLDILALDPEGADRWWCRTDIVPVIDPNEIARCEFLDEPLHIHADPLSWLRASVAAS